MCSFRIAIAGQHVAILTDFLVIQLVGTVRKHEGWTSWAYINANDHSITRYLIVFWQQLAVNDITETD